MRNVTLHRFAIIMAALVCILSGSALDLPVKKLDGTSYYYYKVKKNETVYGVSKKLGLTRDEIVRHNPSADDGLKKGMVLYFPYDEYSPETTAQTEAESPVEEVADTVAAIRPTIALMLPFGLENPEPSRRNRLALDFYKGFLLAADTLAQRPGMVDIYAIDTEVDSARFGALLDSPEIAGASVIVAPDSESDLRRIAESTAGNGVNVLNIFIVADSLYLTYPQVLQANIPQRDMYRIAVDAFEADFGDFIPVILRSQTGKNEKEQFVNYLMERCVQRGVTPIEVNYESNLVSANLDALDLSAGQKYVIVPSSGSLAEFNKFAYVVKTFRDRIEADPEAEGVRIEVFGYPDWTVFRNDALDILHKLGATVYSRFFDNFRSFDSRNIQADFKRWYGDSIIESVPSHALLGYDTGCYLIRNLRTNGGQYNPLNPRSYQGLQSTFDFTRSGEGYCNSVLYIIKYLPDGSMTSRVL